MALISRIFKNTFLSKLGASQNVDYNSNAGEINYQNQASTQLRITSDPALRACKITYHSNDGSDRFITTMSFSGLTLLQNQIWKKSGDENRRFLGWSLTTSINGLIPANYYEITEDIDLYAIWEDKNNIIVIYHSNDSRGLQSSYVMPAGKQHYAKNLFKSPSYPFLGWSTDKDDFQGITKGSFIVSGNGSPYHFYAIWDKTT